jgi:hypothetical protein
MTPEKANEVQAAPEKEVKVEMVSLVKTAPELPQPMGKPDEAIENESDKDE